MTESEARQKYVGIMQSWVGRNEAAGTHKAIIDIYNAHKPLARGYAVKYTDAWCATCVSAAAIKAGFTDIIPIECGCGEMVKLAQGMGIWQERDDYLPAAGDIIMYDWQDSGSGDNTGMPDHVGVIEKVSGRQVTVIEGNKDNAVGRRYLQINGRFIRGYICPKFYKKATTAANTASSAAKKSTAEIAREVLAGRWGNGEARKVALENAGYDYAAIQAEVNRLASGQSGSLAKSVTEVAQEVITGKWGNGEDRKKRLTEAGYDYQAVQNEVNRLMS